MLIAESQIPVTCFGDTYQLDNQKHKEEIMCKINFNTDYRLYVFVDSKQGGYLSWVPMVVRRPTETPTIRPSTFNPTRFPTATKPTHEPTKTPSIAPTTLKPTRFPTLQKPTHRPTEPPTIMPTTLKPTRFPTLEKPTHDPTRTPTVLPTTIKPTRFPSTNGFSHRPFN
eukprot:UN30720